MSSASSSPTGSSSPAGPEGGDPVALRRHRADVERNRKAWAAWAADYFDPGLDNWMAHEPTWGIWRTPESELGLLDEVVAGTEAIDLGCGTGYVCAWLARLGALPVGIDVSDEQLENARLLQKQFRQSFPLIRTSADEVPFEDGSFDFAISEYGASIWVDPQRWVPEAARLLRPGGQLVFFVNGAILMACTPEDGTQTATALERDYFGMYRFEFPGEASVEFHLPHGEWVRLLRANGFELENLIEVRPPEEATTRYSFVSAEWARRWPSEEIWVARRRA